MMYIMLMILHQTDCVHCLTDVPHSYHHYYSNPSYHTLSQNRPPLPHIPNNHEHTIKVKVSFG